jgi:hypothetical protein
MSRPRVAADVDARSLRQLIKTFERQSDGPRRAASTRGRRARGQLRLVRPRRHERAQALALPQGVGQRAEFFRAPQLRRPATAGVQNGELAAGPVGRALGLAPVLVARADWKLEVVGGVGHVDAERGPREREVLAYDVRARRDVNSVREQEAAGRLAQVFAGKAVDLGRAGEARDEC